MNAYRQTIGFTAYKNSAYGKTAIDDIRLEELLHRSSVSIDMSVASRLVKNKVVLITGGAGSIGSEICRQVLKLGASLAVIFDISENGLFHIGNELKKSFGAERFALRIGSVRDTPRLNEIFREFDISIVFHAAAHKHVPMMEFNPIEAVKNNVFGTRNTAKAAMAWGADRFILISTDKAVNPTNIMGATKRIAELTVLLLNSQSKKTKLSAVRFGNVLGSSGSVVPHFIEQIKNGGPVTVTHPDMRRYFMTIPEAVGLVLEASAIGDGGEIFVLDMGRPVKIYDLACDLICRAGLVPNKDIKIEFCGLRPGEKLFEEIRLAEEDVTKTDNNKIFILRQDGKEKRFVSEITSALEKSCGESNLKELFRLVKQLVPTFSGGIAGDKVV